MANFYSGTSGLVLPVKNKLEYPEELREKSRLHFYSTLFNTIEINSTFYKLPQRKTVERWVSEVTPDFRFTFKVSKEITHNKELVFNTQSVKEFLRTVEVPLINQGCLLIQFPGKLSAEYHSQLKKLLKLLTHNNNWRLAIEFRNESWYKEKTVKLLSQYNAATVIHDLKLFTLEPMEEHPDLVYIRFHGTEKNYRGSYTDESLKSYAEKIKQYVDSDKDVFAYFNNTLGPAAGNLMMLNSLVSRRMSISV